LLQANFFQGNRPKKCRRRRDETELWQRWTVISGKRENRGQRLTAVTSAGTPDEAFEHDIFLAKAKAGTFWRFAQPVEREALDWPLVAERAAASLGPVVGVAKKRCVHTPAEVCISFSAAACGVKRVYDWFTMLLCAHCGTNNVAACFKHQDCTFLGAHLFVGPHPLQTVPKNPRL
jgi:hypothetical protein